MTNLHTYLNSTGKTMSKTQFVGHLKNVEKVSTFSQESDTRKKQPSKRNQLK